MSQLLKLRFSSGSQFLKLSVVSMIFLVVGLSVGLLTYPYVFHPQNLSSTINQVVVTVNYNSQWEGVYGQYQVNFTDWWSTNPSLTTANWSGTGSQSVTLTRPVETGDTVWIIYAGAQKLDSTSTQLTVRIAKSDGTTLVEATNSSSHGSVQVGYYLHGDHGQTFELPVSDYVHEESGPVLIVENVRFYAVDSTNNRTEINLRNTGTSSAKIVAVYWSSSSFSALAKIGTSEYTMSPSTGVVDALSSITIMVKWGTSGGVVTDSTWTSGNTYYFKIVTETEQYLEFPAKAP